ncbi:MAG TPA: hypothetical protein VG900_06565 [Hyphomicrobiaceae bacterium]|jgi:hypothetical protein|nr:hypothetical protein [Hyphomicrobiaceae bacterium]
MRAWSLAASVLALALFAGAGCLVAQTCPKSEFEAVVDEAGAALRDLNQQNTPAFQAKLRQLRDKRGWTHDQFLTQAAPFVRDERIAGFDRKSEELLARITSESQPPPPGKTADCALLAELRASMHNLIETQKAKWAYMFDKIDKELAR